MVRSTATKWTKDSLLAVDGGTHLASIIKILEEHLPNAVHRKSSEAPVLAQTSDAVKSLVNGVPASAKSSHHSNSTPNLEVVHQVNGNNVASSVHPGDAPKPMRYLTTGPFAGLELPYESAKANAAYILRKLITTYLLTHPHLDHMAGFGVNTASFEQTSRPKRLAALPFTIDAIKTHIFNDIIWPNMSDEDGGIGLLSYSRLSEGGNNAVGEGGGRGYIELCDGLAVRSRGVSHGNCKREGDSHSGSNGGNLQEPHIPQEFSGRSSRSTPSRRQSQGNDKDSVIESAAFFLRDEHTGNEVVIFGDVEPDSLSARARNYLVWHDAAPKVSSGVLKGIVIECSYEDSRDDKLLFGHLTPRHLMVELQVLGGKVAAIKRSEDMLLSRKRKRQSNGMKVYEDQEVLSQQGRNQHQTRRRTRTSSISPSEHTSEDLTISRTRQTSRALSISPTTTRFPGVYGSDLAPEPQDATDKTDPENNEIRSPTMPAFKSLPSHRPLEGLQVIIIHIKDTLDDGPPLSETILAQLLKREEEAQLGCTFSVSKTGSSIWL